MATCGSGISSMAVPDTIGHDECVYNPGNTVHGSEELAEEP
jgi:hypothetical protein